jgi:hypothetical protein
VVHLIGGRRNVFVWMLTVGFLLGTPAKTFIIMTFLELATVILHLPRAISVFYRAYKESQIQARTSKAFGVE